MALMAITKMEMKAAMKEARQQRKINTCSETKPDNGNACKLLNISKAVNFFLQPKTENHA